MIKCEIHFPDVLLSLPCLTTFISYTVAYVDFFDSQVKARGGDWKSVVSEYLYSGTEPLINGLAGGRA